MEVVSDAALVRELACAWWIFLVTGILWLLFSVIVFRFDWTSV